MRKIVKLFLNPITWILVSLGIIAAKKAVMALATGSGTPEPTAGDELPDDDAPI